MNGVKNIFSTYKKVQFCGPSWHVFWHSMKFAWRFGSYWFPVTIHGGAIRIRWLMTAELRGSRLHFNPSPRVCFGADDNHSYPQQTSVVWRTMTHRFLVSNSFFQHTHWLCLMRCIVASRECNVWPGWQWQLRMCCVVWAVSGTQDIFLWGSQLIRA